MKVIFIEDVPDVARAGEAKEVADGYGRNYLLPKKLAVLANSAASNVVEAQLKKVAVKRAQAEAEMAELAGKLEGVEITLKARTGAKDRLYGSITSADIADELSNSAGLVIDKRKIELEEPIRQLGSYEVTIRLTQDIAPVIGLAVVADKVTKEKPEKEEKKGKAKAAKKDEEKEGKAKAAKKDKEKEGKAKAAKKDKEKEGKAKAAKKGKEKVEAKAEKEEETEPGE